MQKDIIYGEKLRANKVGDYVEIRNVETLSGVNKKLLPKF